MTEVEVVTEPGGLDWLAPVWNALADARSAGPFSLPSVASAWWNHLGRGRLCIVVVRRGQEVLSIAPLHERRFGGLVVHRWVGHGLGVVGEVLERPGDGPTGSAAIWSVLAARRRAVLELVDWRRSGEALPALSGARPWASRATVHDVCPVIDLDGSRSARDYLARPGRRRLRQNMARVDRALEAAGVEATVEVVERADRVEAVLEELAPVVEAAELHRPRLNLLDARHRGFTVEVLRSAASSGRLALIVLRHDERAVGAHVLITAGRVASAWYARFHPDASPFSPGHQLLRAAVEWASANEAIERIDLQLGGDQYKRTWASGEYETLDVLAARHQLLTVARAVLAVRERGRVSAGASKSRLRRLREPAAV